MTAQRLSLDTMLPRLPNAEACARVSAVDLAEGHMRELLLDPRCSLERDDPPTTCPEPASVMTEPGELLGSIRGVVPNLVGDLSGCMFRNRCQRASAECATLGDTPTLLEDGHAYTCVLSPEQALAVPEQAYPA